MKLNYGIENADGNPVGGALPPVQATREALTEERLPFTIGIARDAQALDRAVRVRHAAYARHVPDFAERLRMPEPCDHEDGVVVLLAESKLDGSSLGTMRVQTNRFRPLAIEQSVRLPESMRAQSLAGATRLGVSLGRVGRLVKIMLFKAFYLYCREEGIDWIVIAARAPLDRHYQALMFEDVFGAGAFTPLRHACNIPHRIMALNVPTAQARWREARHPMLELFCGTRHPDIDLGRSAAPWRAARLPREVARVAVAA